MIPVVISVIIPVYNAESYLKRCAESVLSQTFSGEMEILLIDDGSTDRSGDICDELAQDDSRITVFHTENRGASLARRLGLERAKGDYVTFVDSDDFVKPRYLEALLAQVKETGCSMGACAIEGRINRDFCTTVRVLSFDELMRRFFKYEFWGFYAKIYARGILEETLFPQATISEDYYVMAQLFAKEKQMAFLPEELYCYERHEASLSQTPISDRAFEEFENVKGVFEFISTEVPMYRDYALSNATETAVKLLLASRREKARFEHQRRVLSSFLSSHRTEILACKPLLPKTRVLAATLSF